MAKKVPIPTTKSDELERIDGELDTAMERLDGMNDQVGEMLESMDLPESEERQDPPAGVVAAGPALKETVAESKDEGPD